jgi:hypothetical protein
MSSRKRTTATHALGSNKSRTSKKSAEEVVSGAQAMLEQLAEEDATVEKEENKEFEPKELASLKKLISLGRVTKTVEYDGFNFKLITLKNSEKGEAIADLARIDEEDRPLHVRQLTLSRAIESVNGVPLEGLYDVVCPDGESDDIIQQRIEILEELQSILVEALYIEYENMISDSIKIFSSDGASKIKK